MVNEAEKILKDIGHKEEVEKPKKETPIKTRISKNNPSVNKNSQWGGDF